MGFEELVEEYYFSINKTAKIHEIERNGFYITVKFYNPLINSNDSHDIYMEELLGYLYDKMNTKKKK